MNKWPKAKIGEVSLGIYDGPHATPAPCETPGPYFLGIPQISPLGFIDMSSPRYIAERDYGAWTKRVVPQYGDVIFSYEATLNLYALIPRDFKCCLGRRMGLVRPNPKKLDFQFLYYYFFSPEWRGTVRENTITGATVDRLSIAAFPNFEIALPPLPMQRRIATILSDYDSAIDNARRQIALLEEAAMRLYREWFVVHADPKWEKKRIVDVCVKIGAGGTPNRRQEKYWLNGTIAWIKTKELQDCWLFDSEEKITPAGLDGSSAKIFPENTVVMAIYASPTLGRLGILDKPMCCNQAALCLVADESQVSWEWLYCQLFELRDEFNRIARGAGQQNISGEVVKETVVRIPDIHAMSEFTNAARPLFSQCRILGRQIGNLTEVRDRLLPKLMSGEIEV